MYGVMRCNFLWETESNRRYNFELGNFAGIGPSSTLKIYQSIQLYSIHLRFRPLHHVPSQFIALHLRRSESSWDPGLCSPKSASISLKFQALNPPPRAKRLRMRESNPSQTSR